MSMLKTWTRDLVGLFFPNLCTLCKNELLDSEQQICSSCLFDLPETNFLQQKENPLASKMLGRFPFERIIALYYFNTEGKVQQILHEIKYRKNQELAEFMGAVLAIKADSSLQHIDAIVPIPLHQKRFQHRGFNQSSIIGQKLAQELRIDFKPNAVHRIKNTETQTNKTRLERMENMKNAFEWQEDASLQNAHILLLDDVITTGATLESCILAAPKHLNLKFSILTLAAAVDS